MKATVTKNNEIFFINLEGSLNLDSLDTLKELCSKNLKKKKIVFNLNSLDFVGSVGVDLFSKTLELLQKESHLKVCCASSEFEKVLTNEGFFIYPTERDAISSFENH